MGGWMRAGRCALNALGATLYVLAAGRRPFGGRTITELLLQVVTEQPPPLRAFVDQPRLRPSF
ncbi:MAG: hypothetical protein U0903_06575 [Planctomycetales bacterium]